MIVCKMGKECDFDLCVGMRLCYSVLCNSLFEQGVYFLLVARSVFACLAVFTKPDMVKTFFS